MLKCEGLEGTLRKCIKNTAERVCKSAVVVQSGTAWLGPFFYSDSKWRIERTGMQFYDGMGGIAVFLAAYLKKFSDGEAYHLFEIAQQELFRYTQQCLSDKRQKCVKTGLLEGEGSVVFTYLRLYEITGKYIFLDYARQHYLIVERAMKEDVSYDLLGGNAGGIVLACRMFELTGEDHYKELAVQMGEWLWNTAIYMEQGCGFRVASEMPPLAGIAHGNSGFLVAYGKLWEITGKERYCERIRMMLVYEDSLYSKEYGNWLDLRGKDTCTVMNAWCHGAPGILLSRFCLLRVLQKQDGEEKVTKCEAQRQIRQMVDRDIERASCALFLQNPGEHICLCHGIAGNLLFMHWFLQSHSHSLYQSKYEELLHNFVQNFDLYTEKAVNEYLNPGFMNGISGVGFVLSEIYTDIVEKRDIMLL